MNCKCEWVEQRAYERWQKAGCPENRDLEFWLAAEQDFGEPTCILSFGLCPHQIEQPITKGGHITICTRPPGTKCHYRATNYL